MLVEYEQDSNNVDITQHDIDMRGFSTIRINKLKTDNYTEIYSALSDLTLPVSAMDIRKVQSIVKEIYSGGNIKVSITEDIDGLANSEKILAIGSTKTITYEYQTVSELMENYFNIIEEANHQLLKLIDKMTIQNTQFFPIYGFEMIQSEISCKERLKEIQNNKIKTFLENPIQLHDKYIDIESVINDSELAAYKKEHLILYGVLYDRFNLEDTEEYLKKFEDKKITQYRRLLCVYDLKKYAPVLNIV